jgi:putative transposase
MTLLFPEVLMETKDGAFYRRRLPHYRSPGSIYHVRFSVDCPERILRAEWMFELVEQSLFFGHKRRYCLHAYTIMANHTHIVLQPLPKRTRWEDWCDYTLFYRLEDIIHSVKRFTSLEINRRLARRGSNWEEEYFDRTIRGDKDLVEVIDYIHHNPVRWKLVSRPELYRWSSASTIYSEKPEFADWFKI